MPANCIKVFDKYYPVPTEEEQRDRQYTLYLWTRNVDGVQYVKFGEAFKASVWDRYNNTGDSQHLEMIYLWKSAVHDKKIHELLQKYPQSWKWAGKKTKNPLNTQEAYIVESSKDVDAIIEFITKASKRRKIGPNFFRDRGCELPKLKARKYQKDVIEKCKQILSVQDKCLLNLSTRAGKSFVSLKIAKELDAKNILIFTPFPAAEESFRHLAELNREFRGFKYLKLSHKIKSTELCKKNIIFCSYQYYDENKDLIKSIKQLYFDLIILDESHNTSDTERTYSILESLKYNKLLYMSGTPFNDIYSSAFSKNEIVTLDFIDFIEYSKKNPHEIKLPNLHILNVSNMESLNNMLNNFDPEIFTKTDAFKFDTIFSDSLHANRFFHWLTNTKEDLIFEGDHWFDYRTQNKILAFFNTNNEVKHATLALNNIVVDPNSEFYGYKVVQISGDDGVVSVSEDYINKIFSEENRVIITTCGKLTTGVTLPALDTIWYFKSSKSSELFVQILFRTMTAYEGKENVKMFCFDSETSLKMIRDYTLIREQNEETRVYQKEFTSENVLRQMMNCIRFSKLEDNLEWKDFTVAELLQKTQNIPVQFSSTALFKNLSALENITFTGKKIGSKPLFVASGLGGNDVEHCEHNAELLSRQKKKKSVEKDCFKKTCKQFLFEMSTIDKTIWVNINKIKSYKSLFKFMPDMFIGNENVFKKLLSDNNKLLNDAISMIRLKDSTPEGRIQLLNNLSQPSVEESFIKEEDLDKMLSFVNFDKDSIIMDPCCGPGFLLQKIYEKGVSKNRLFGITTDYRDSIIANKLGFKVINGDCLDDKNWRHCSLSIINPPYKGNFHVKVMAIAALHSDEVVCKSPVEWLVRPFAKDSWEKLKQKYRKRFVHLKVEEIEEKHEFDLAIFTIKKDNSWDYENFYLEYSKEELDDLKKMADFDKFDNHVIKYSDSTKQYFVPLKVNINAYCNASKDYLSSYLRLIQNNSIIEGDYKGLSVEDAVKSNPHINVGSGMNIVGVEFDKLDEAKNFLKYIDSPTFVSLVSRLKKDRRVPFERLPFLEYTKEWSEDELKELFEK